MDNPFEDIEIAKEWIRSVEGEKEQIRDKYIYPLLVEWLERCGKEKAFDAGSVKGRMLDIGCGQGVASQFCKGFEYYGIDSSSELLERAKLIYNKNGIFIQGNAYSLPFENSFFDAVFSINVWFHLADLHKASQELARILSPEGQFLIVTACPDSYDLWMQTFEDPKHHGKRVDCVANLPLHVKLRNTHYLHTHNEIISSLENAKLTVLGTKSFAPCDESELFQENTVGRHLFQYYSGLLYKRA